MTGQGESGVEEPKHRRDKFARVWLGRRQHQQPAEWDQLSRGQPLQRYHS